MGCGSCKGKDVRPGPDKKEPSSSRTEQSSPSRGATSKVTPATTSRQVTPAPTDRQVTAKPKPKTQAQVPILGYWAIHGRGDFCRMLLTHLNIKYEDKRYQFDDKSAGSWSNQKSKLGMVFPNLPYFVDGDVKLSETLSIIRYICRHHRPEYLGRNQNEQAYADSFCNTINDMLPAWAPFIMPDDWASKREEACAVARKNIEIIKAMIGKKNFIAGNGVTYVDFLAYGILKLFRSYDPALVAEVPLIAQYMTSMYSLKYMPVAAAAQNKIPIWPPFAGWQKAQESLTKKKTETENIALLKRVLVTGGNSGIGYALCKLLAVKHGCYVYMGTRSMERGTSALQTMIQEDSKCKNKVEVIQVDVANASSISACAAVVKEKLGKQTLYALVNNAGTGEWVGQGCTRDQMIATNIYGPKLMTEALAPLISPTGGRIVNVSSGMGPRYISKLDQAKQTFWSSQPNTWAQVEPAFQALFAALTPEDKVDAYSLTKAVLNKYTEISAKENPNVLISSISPGFIDTGLSAGFNASKSPEEGCLSTIKCLFRVLPGSGFHYGSDALRSPLHFERQPGEPEFKGYGQLPVLGYWACHGKGDFCRMLLYHLGVKFEDKRFKFGDESSDGWNTQKPKLGMTFPTLPYFINGDIAHSETLPILRSICRQYQPEYLGRNQTEQAYADSFCNTISDLQSAWLPAYVGPEDWASKKQEALEAGKNHIETIGNCIGNKRFVAGNEVTYADFVAFGHLKILKRYDESLVAELPKIVEYMQNMSGLKGMADAVTSQENIPFVWPMAGWQKDVGNNIQQGKLNQQFLAVPFNNIKMDKIAFPLIFEIMRYLEPQHLLITR